MAPEKPKPRKRNRKRKRRNVSSSSSSSSSSSFEDDTPQAAPIKPAVTVDDDADDSDSSTSTSSSSSSSTRAPDAMQVDAPSIRAQPRRRLPSRSPSPPIVDIPPLIPSNPTTDAEKEKVAALKEKFRKFWMASVADGFKEDLEEIRKEPNLSTSRLALLIDSLASGADVFSASGSGEVNEMELVLEAAIR